MPNLQKVIIIFVVIGAMFNLPGLITPTLMPTFLEDKYTMYHKGITGHTYTSKYISRLPIRINNNSDFELYASSGDGSKNNPWILENFDIFGLGFGYCIYIGNTTDYFIIKNCNLHYSHGYSAKYYENVGLYLYNVSNGIIDNVTLSKNYNGIHIYNSHNITISNCIIMYNYDNGIYMSYSHGNVVSNCMVTGSNSNGIYLYYSHGNVVSNCTVTGSNNNGIHLYYSNNNLVSYGTVSYNINQGIFIKLSSENDFMYNSVHHNEEAGIYIEASNNSLIKGNKIFNNSNNGINMFSTTRYNTISDNFIMNNTENGIMLGFMACYNIIENNTIINNTKDAIYLRSPQGNKICGNTMYNCGIFIYDISSNSLEGTVIDDKNTVNGKFVYFFKDVAGGNVSANCGQLILVNCTHFFISGHLIRNVSMGMIVAKSSNVTIVNNTITHTKTGISIINSNNILVMHNYLEYCQDGIYIESTTDNTIKNNTIINCEGYGITIYYSECNIVMDNTVSVYRDTHDNIMLYYSDNNIITQNRVYHGNKGIHLEYSSYNNISFNKIMGNTYAIFLEKGAVYNTITMNTVARNIHGIKLVQWSGSYGLESNHNLITYNNFCDNEGYALNIFLCINNSIHHNNFFYNNGGDVQAYDEDGGNKWYSEEWVGNYWSDYTKRYPTATNDGYVWNKPYSINGGGSYQCEDMYPVVDPFLNGTIDIQAPHITDKTLGFMTTGDNFTFEVIITDDVCVKDATIAYYYGSDKHETYNLSLIWSHENVWTCNIPVLPYTTEDFHYEIYATDYFGHVSKSKEKTLHIIDNDPPVIIDHSQKKATTGETFVFSTIAYDNIITVDVYVEYWFNNGTHYNSSMFWNGENWTYTITIPTNLTGTMYYIFSATDISNNWASICLGPVYIYDNDPPMAVAGGNKVALVGVETYLNAGGSSDNVGIVEYHWTLTYDSQKVNLSGMVVNFTFGILGRWKVVLEVVDCSGNIDTDVIFVYVVEDVYNPVAEAGNDRAVQVGETVILDGTNSYDPDLGLEAGILNYTWTFKYNGDTITLYGPTVPFTFMICGIYRIKLIVTDLSGKSSHDTVIIKVMGNVTISVGPVKDINGTSLSNVTVSIKYGDAEYRNVTGEDGIARFVLPFEIVDEDVTIVLSKEGYSTVILNTTLDTNLTDIPLMKRTEINRSDVDNGDWQKEKSHDVQYFDNAMWGIAVLIIIAMIGIGVFVLYRRSRSVPKLDDRIFEEEFAVDDELQYVISRELSSSKKEEEELEEEEEGAPPAPPPTEEVEEEKEEGEEEPKEEKPQEEEEWKEPEEWPEGEGEGWEVVEEEEGWEYV